MDTIAILRELYKEIPEGETKKREQLREVANAFENLQSQNEDLATKVEAFPLPEAPASATVKVVNTHTQMEWLFTVRSHDHHSLLATMPDVEKFLLAFGYASFDAYVDRRRAERGENNGKSNSSPVAPPMAASDDPREQETLTFPAQTLVATVNKGKAYWKVQGGKFTKFGVTIWPETLKSAGFSKDKLDPMKTYDLTGFTATYVTKDDGKPEKVISLNEAE